MAKRAWVVRAEMRAVDIIWAETRKDAIAAADFDDGDWEIANCYEADDVTCKVYGERSVYDGEQWRDLSELIALNTPEAIAEREATEKARREFEAHPKLLVI